MKLEECPHCGDELVGVNWCKNCGDIEELDEYIDDQLDRVKYKVGSVTNGNKKD